VSRRVLALVVAHPDDDAYGLAGTVALHADDPAFRFGLIHATLTTRTVGLTRFRETSWWSDCR
jgi:LmbE family N-acetylglucosaminyl deacetylase